MRVYSGMIVISASLFLLMLLSGCSTNSVGPGTSTMRTSARLTIQWPSSAASAGRLVPAATQSIKLVLSDTSGFSTNRVVDRPATGTSTTVTFTNVPVGALTVTATAYPQTGAAGTPLATGTSPLTTVAGQQASITLTMASTIDHLDITSTTLTTPTLGTLQLTATPKDSSGNVVLVAAGNISWTSGTLANATVDSTGKVTGVHPGTAVITATESDTQKSASVTVTVTDAPPVAAFTATPATGTTATVFTVDASASTDTEDPASALQVRWDWDSTGTWTTATTTKTATHTYSSTGTHNITLEVKDSAGLTSTTTQSVTVTAVPVAVSLNPTAATVSVGKTTPFTATVTNTSNTAVTWSVVEAGGGSVSNTGVYTAPSTPGTYHVTATSVADNTKSATATVTVQAGDVVIIVK